jgi:hypothetical protein
MREPTDPKENPQYQHQLIKSVMNAATALERAYAEGHADTARHPSIIAERAELVTTSLETIRRDFAELERCLQPKAVA